MIDITGKKDAISIKEEYQKALDYSHEKISNKVSFLYKMNHKLKENLALVQQYKKDIISHEEERKSLYRNLEELLNKEKVHEKDMWSVTKENEKDSNVVIKQKFNDSDIDEVKFNSIRENIKQYPEYHTMFKKNLEIIDKKESDIRYKKERYNHAISAVLKELSYFPRNIIEAEGLVKRFKAQLKEGQEKLNSMRYLKSFLYKLASETEKIKVNIHTLYYRVEEMEDTIQKLKEESEKARKQNLEEMDY